MRLLDAGEVVRGTGGSGAYLVGMAKGLPFGKMCQLGFPVPSTPKVMLLSLKPTDKFGVQETRVTHGSAMSGSYQTDYPNRKKSDCLPLTQ